MTRKYMKLYMNKKKRQNQTMKNPGGEPAGFVISKQPKLGFVNPQ